MLQPIGQYAKSQGLDLRNGLITGLPVDQRTREVRNFSYPTAVIFLFNFDPKAHSSIPACPLFPI